jgi:trans-aconitate methyltransferase
MTKNTWNANLYDSKHNFVTNYGNDIIELLNPQANEKILDLGCGSGALTAKIATMAKEVTGIDASREMIAQAKQHYPDVDFIVHDATREFPFTDKFDAVFSNAALHWMLDADTVAKNIAKVLKPDGWFVFEMGGKNNIKTIIKSIEYAASKFDTHNLPIYNFFPTISEYSTILEKNGFAVKYAALFDRPTPLDGEEGLRNWIRMFRNGVLENIDKSNHEQFFELAEEFARDKLYKDKQWIADYVRLRMIAIKI